MRRQTELERKQEHEANQFAMCLLMPEWMVRKEVNKLGGFDMCDDKKMTLLARTFQVPVTLMALRVGQLFDRP